MTATTGIPGTPAARPGRFVLGAGLASTAAPSPVPPVIRAATRQRPSGTAATPTPKGRP